MNFFAILFLAAIPLVKETSSPLDTVNRMMSSYMEEKGIPGGAVALVLKENTYLLNYGLADKDRPINISEDTIFEIASITKVFTATELALEVLRGHMRLKDPVVRFFPHINPKSAINRVTLGELATHTSGLPRLIDPTKVMGSVAKERIIDFLNTWQPEVTIGSHFLYSNLGYGILGIALENAGKQSYQELIEKDILKPLQMISTMVEVPEALMERYAVGYSSKETEVPRFNNHNITPGSGALKSTSKDMLQFLRANLGIIGPENLREAMEFAMEPQFIVSSKLTMGLGWQRIHRDALLIIDKNGGHPGFSSYIGFIPEHNIGIVILVNMGHVNPARVGRKILQQLSKEYK